MGNIKIKSVNYSGDNYYYNSPEFSDGLNIILGTNGSGKTTFCDLIYYALGGEAQQFNEKSSEPHNEIINDVNNYVELTLELNSKEYSFKRYINENNISIKICNEKDDKEEYEYLPIIRHKEHSPYTFSDWLLEKLQINPVSLFDGYKSYVINIKDLSRLIYHDQGTEPKKIYKNPIKDDNVQNTEFIRKVIFELLLGENFEEYYLSTNAFRKAEIEKNKAKALLEDYSKLAKEIRANCNIELNIKFAEQKRSKLADKLAAALMHRESLKNSINKTDYDTEISTLRERLLVKQDELDNFENKHNDNSKELYSLRDVERTLSIEINQLKKIIYTNEKINLFAFNTCPWCLKELPEKQEENICYCGNTLEDEKIVFEYNTEEYKTILKAKNKTLKTLSSTIQDIIAEIDLLKINKTKLKKEINAIKEEINKYLKDYNNPINFQKIDENDNEIKDLRDNINELDKYIKIERKLDDLRQKHQNADNDYKEKKTSKEIFEKKAKKDIFEKIKSFNIKFQELMTNSLEDCKTACIDDENYMPIIDNGCYREKSASVHVRLMYFYTLLYMSLKYTKIKFPRFLLIDTPDTNGIDPESLKRAIKQLENIEVEGEKYQVILTTLEYPEDFKDCIKGDKLIKKENYLLKKVEIIDDSYDI